VSLPKVCDICKKSDELCPYDVHAADPTLETLAQRIVTCSTCKMNTHISCYVATSALPVLMKANDAAYDFGSTSWQCEPCALAMVQKVTHACVACPNPGGALKYVKPETVTSQEGSVVFVAPEQWCHAVCAQFVPELYFGNELGKTDVENMPYVLKYRKVLLCELCHRKMGACIQCDYAKCYRAYHVTCAIAAAYSGYVLSAMNDAKHPFQSWCPKHSGPMLSALLKETDPIKQFHRFAIYSSSPQPGGGGTRGGGPSTPLMKRGNAAASAGRSGGKTSASGGGSRFSTGRTPVRGGASSVNAFNCSSRLLLRFDDHGSGGGGGGSSESKAKAKKKKVAAAAAKTKKKRKANSLSAPSRAKIKKGTVVVKRRKLGHDNGDDADDEDFTMRSSSSSAAAAARN
jgi:hypothetical protein